MKTVNKLFAGALMSLGYIGFWYTALVDVWPHPAFQPGTAAIAVGVIAWLVGVVLLLKKDNDEE